MNNQEIFDKVATHLLTQNVKSILQFPNGVKLESNIDIGIDSGCAYRGIDGMSCAVGCLISDDLYDINMEGYGLMHPNVYLILNKVGIRVSSRSLLTDVQTVHDTTHPDMWKDGLIKAAKTSNLNYDIVTNFKKTDE